MRMPVIFAAHGAPVLLDDDVWMSELAAWAKAMPKPTSSPDGVGSLGAAPDDAGRDAAGAARLRLLRFPGEVLPDHGTRPRARRPGRRVRELLDQRKHRRGPTTSSAASTTGRTCRWWRCTRTPTCRCCRSRCRPSTRRSSSRSAARSRRCATRACSCSAAASSPTTCATRSGPASRRGRGSSTRGWPTRCSGSTWTRSRTSARRAPAADLALPTWEHYAPLLVSAGASAETAARPKVTFPITGFWMDGAFTKRSVQFE